MTTIKKSALLLAAAALTQVAGCSYIAHSDPVRGGAEDTFCTPSHVPHGVDGTAALLAPLAGLAAGLVVYDMADDARWAPIGGFAAGATLSGLVLAPSYRHGRQSAASCRAFRLAREQAWADYRASRSPGGRPTIEGPAGASPSRWRDRPPSG